MKIHCHDAVVSFCPDLTSPSARSVPVAVLTLAEVDGTLLAAAFGRDVLDVDPLTAEMLADVPELLKHQLSEIAARRGGTPNPKALLRAMQDALRNSLHIPTITERDVVLPDDISLTDLYWNLLRPTLEQLQVELRAAGIELAQPRALSRRDHENALVTSLGTFWRVDHRRSAVA
jgi:hypothetical protein